MDIMCIQYGNLMNPYARGGLPLILHETLKRLAFKHHITCFTGLWPDESRSFMVDDIEYIQKGMGKNKYLNRVSFSISRSFYTPDGKCDLILLPWDRYAPVMVNTKDYPVVLNLHLDYFNAPSKLFFIEPLVKSMLMKQLKRSHYLMAVSRGAIQHAMQYAGNVRLSSIIHTGISKEMFGYSKGHMREDYLLFLGRLDIRHKGIDTLLKAYKRASIQIPLKIVGEGSDQKRIQKLITDLKLNGTVEMIGWLEGDAKIEMLKNCLAVCMPSRLEGFSIVALEAAAMGKPVIGTRVGGLDEAVIHGVTGLLVQKDSIDEYAKVIKTIVENKELRKDLGRRAKERVYEFTYENAAGKMEHFFSMVVEDFCKYKGK